MSVSCVCTAVPFLGLLTHPLSPPSSYWANYLPLVGLMMHCELMIFRVSGNGVDICSHRYLTLYVAASLFTTCCCFDERIGGAATSQKPLQLWGGMYRVEQQKPHCNLKWWQQLTPVGLKPLLAALDMFYTVARGSPCSVGKLATHPSPRTSSRRQLRLCKAQRLSEAPAALCLA